MIFLADVGLFIGFLCALSILGVAVLVGIGCVLTWLDHRNPQAPAAVLHTVCRCGADLGDVPTLLQSQAELALHELLDCPMVLRDRRGVARGAR